MKRSASFLCATLMMALAPAAVAESEPFAAETLHDIELPAPGHFRLEVNGQLFEGKVEGMHGLPITCKADSDYDARTQLKMFSFQQDVIVGERDRMTIGMNRSRYQDEAGWHRMMGWENDQVQVTVGRDARSRLFVRRIEPGSSPYRVAETGSGNAGEHEMPMIRFRHDEHLTATAVGNLHAIGDNPDALTGPFELAVVCP